MADNELKVKIEADTSGLTKGLQDGARQARKFSDDVSKSFQPIGSAINNLGSQVTSGFSNAFNSLGKGVAVGNLVAGAITSAAGAIKDFVTSSVGAAIEQENAINRLNQALRASGDFSAKASQDFRDFSAELQQASVIGDEVALGQLAVAKSFGATNQQAKDLVLAAANLSATFGGSLEENVTKLGATLQGSIGRLGKVSSEFKNLTEEQLKSGAALDLVNQKFAGAAANELNTYEGKVKSLENSISDFQEVLGTLVTESDFVKGGVTVLSGLFQELTQRFADSRIEAARQKDGFVESAGSVAQLSREMDSLKVQLIDQEQIILRNKDAGFLDSLFTFDNVPLAKEKVQELTIKINELQQQIISGNQQIAASEPAAAAATGTTPGATKNPNEITPEQKAAILAQRQDLNNAIIQQQLEFEASQLEADLVKKEAQYAATAQDYDELLAAEDAKIEATRQAELQKAALVADAENRKLATRAANDKADIARIKANAVIAQKEEQNKIKMDAANKQAYLGATQNFINAGLALAKQGSNEQKILDIANATMSTYVATAIALKSAPPPGNFVLAASTLAFGLAQVAKIQGQKFADGGIVGGASFVGDRVPALVNSGEMILNREQQATLFNQANGNSSGSGGVSREEVVQMIRSIPIVVQANGREIARLVRDERVNGFGV
jgi:hypothetical protein